MLPQNLNPERQRVIRHSRAENLFYKNGYQPASNDMADLSWNASANGLYTSIQNIGLMVPIRPQGLDRYWPDNFFPKRQCTQHAPQTHRTGRN